MTTRKKKQGNPPYKRMVVMAPDQPPRLERLKAESGLSMAELIRCAIDHFLDRAEMHLRHGGHASEITMPSNPTRVIQETPGVPAEKWPAEYDEAPPLVAQPDPPPLPMPAIPAPPVRISAIPKMPWEM